MDDYLEKETGVAQHEKTQNCLKDQMQRAAPSVKGLVKRGKISLMVAPAQELLHDESKQITGAFSKMDVSEKVKLKTRGTLHPAEDIHEPAQDKTVEEVDETPQIFSLDKRTYKVFKALFGMHSLVPGDIPKAIKWDEFTRAMVHVGFAVEKLHGSAWQFTPTQIDVQRSNQFHEPHLEVEISHKMARRFGGRLSRAYDWTCDTFMLA